MQTNKAQVSTLMYRTTNLICPYRANFRHRKIEKIQTDRSATMKCLDPKALTNANIHFKPDNSHLQKLIPKPQAQATINKDTNGSSKPNSLHIKAQNTQDKLIKNLRYKHKDKKVIIRI